MLNPAFLIYGFGSRAAGQPSNLTLPLAGLSECFEDKMLKPTDEVLHLTGNWRWWKERKRGWGRDQLRHMIYGSISIYDCSLKNPKLLKSLRIILVSFRVIAYLQQSVSSFLSHDNLAITMMIIPFFKNWNHVEIKDSLDDWHKKHRNFPLKVKALVS